MIFLRKLHLFIGMMLVPFLLLTAVTGVVMLLRTGPLYLALLKWHSWFKWGGIALGAGLAFLAATGAVLYLNMRYLQFKRRKKAAAGGQEG